MTSTYIAKLCHTYSKPGVDYLPLSIQVYNAQLLLLTSVFWAKFF